MSAAASKDGVFLTETAGAEDAAVLKAARSEVTDLESALMS